MDKEDGDVGHEEQLFKWRTPAHTHTRTQLAGSSLARTLKRTYTPPSCIHAHNTHTQVWTAWYPGESQSFTPSSKGALTSWPTPRSLSLSPSLSVARSFSLSLSLCLPIYLAFSLSIYLPIYLAFSLCIYLPIAL